MGGGGDLSLSYWCMYMYIVHSSVQKVLLIREFITTSTYMYERVDRECMHVVTQHLSFMMNYSLMHGRLRAGCNSHSSDRMG